MLYAAWVTSTGMRAEVRVDSQLQATVVHLQNRKVLSKELTFTVLCFDSMETYFVFKKTIKRQIYVFSQIDNAAWEACLVCN